MVEVLDTAASDAQNSNELELLRARVLNLEQAQIESNRTRAILQASEERFRLLSETLPQIIWQTNKEGRAVFYNQRWFDYTGQSFEEALALGWQNALHPDDAESTLQAWEIAVQTGEPYNMEYRLRRADGVFRWFLSRAAPTYNSRGQITSWFGTCTDIDDQKELDYLKDLFVSIVSHELRTPLTIIKGYAFSIHRQLTTQRGEQTLPVKNLDRSLHSLQIIQNQTGRMESMILQLLDFSRIQNRQLDLERTEGVDLVELTGRVIEQFSQTLSNHELQLVTETESLVGFYDPARLEQILANLITNAFKYSPAKTSVVVGLRRDEATNQAIIWVRDKGAGIKPEHQAHIFDRFYRERTQQSRNVEGLGLGLYITHEIVTKHGGRIWVESTPGEGTTFFVALPLKSK